MVEDDEAHDDPRNRWARVAFSLVFAVFAYLGLFLGANLSAGANTGCTSFSPVRENQPLHLSNRDIVRGTLAAERNTSPKPVWHAAGPAALGAVFTTLDWPSLSLHPIAVKSVSTSLLFVHGYRPRGPPRTIAS
ncbi:hypothetical protein EV286_101125 [Rhizobium sp. BK251]|nr:hypothetical protein EV286_101125 [Rhizobium sp. BK251]